jgi:hypothetical protein
MLDWLSKNAERGKQRQDVKLKNVGKETVEGGKFHGRFKNKV